MGARTSQAIPRYTRSLFERYSHSFCASNRNRTGLPARRGRATFTPLDYSKKFLSSILRYKDLFETLIISASP